MSELPTGWEKLALREIAARDMRTIDPSTAPDEEFELYSVPSFSDGRPEILLGNEIKSIKQLVQAGDVLLCKIVPHINRVWTVGPYSGRRQIASGEWIVYRDHHCQPDYLRNLLSESEFRERFLTTVSGVGGSLLRANPKAVGDFEVHIAPEAEQRRIVAKIDDLSGKSKRARDRLDHVPRLVERYRLSLIQAALQGRLTSSWRIKKGVRAEWNTFEAGSLFEWSSGKNLTSKMMAKGPVPVIGGNGISGFHNQSLINFPTIVVGRVGAQCGNVHLTSGPSWITDNAIYARSISESVLPAFAAHVFGSANLNAQAGGSGQPYVNQKLLNQVQVPLPLLDEQDEIVRQIDIAFACINRLAAEATSARKLIDRLNQAVLAKAFRGELVPQDPHDEPASVLLERIRAERRIGSVARRRGPAKRVSQ
jgi:type I restriction enzyme, S subunit